ncbi:response regulator [Sandaracinus amylolyticus]|uniref:Response regulatory domain-containing protein n=1 Tax=Sandaracinus amylolyticus TaxID=927083 RepID=A0A0F6W1N9_9BACT|nr:response regulator [Sandaracinus amylolyticus]AKF04983.1 hypothetical protein DB32_002132 [Sandaracinus amylolyticus]
MMNNDHHDVAELVVLVDDDSASLREIRRVLEEIGLRVLGFTAASAALAAALSRRPDAIVIAHAGVDVEGLALADRVRAAHGDESPAFVAIARSPAALGPVARRAYDVILRRPVGVDELVGAIDDALVLRASRLTRRSARRARAAE